jgi:isoamylase
MAELAYRLTGSSDLYQEDGRHPYASINFIRARRLHAARPGHVQRRHNEANGEDNKDGHSHNLSSNYGVEGETDDPAINEVRERQKRNFLDHAVALAGRVHAVRR